jgi:hypothetical protein
MSTGELSRSDEHIRATLIDFRQGATIMKMC